MDNAFVQEYIWEHGRKVFYFDTLKIQVEILDATKVEDKHYDCKFKILIDDNPLEFNVKRVDLQIMPERVFLKIIRHSTAEETKRLIELIGSHNYAYITAHASYDDDFYRQISYPRNNKYKRTVHTEQQVNLTERQLVETMNIIKDVIEENSRSKP